MFISLDLETTGFHPEKDRIIEFGAIKFDRNGDHESLQILINPGIPIPTIVTHITNINDETVKNAKSFEEVKEEIIDFIGDLPIVGHNISFDTNFLRAQDIDLTNKEYDTFRLASVLLPGVPSYSLEILSRVFDLQHEEKHRALDDAIAAKELFSGLLKEFETLPQELLTQIQALAQKSTSQFKDLILSLKHSPEASTLNKKLREAKTSDAASPHTEILATNTTTLFEFPPPYNQLAKDLAQHADKDTYISLNKDLFKKVAGQIPDTVAKLDIEKNFLSETRLQTFLDKEELQESELLPLIKILIWSKQTTTGLFTEVKALHDEFPIIARTSCDPKLCDTSKEKFIQKAHAKDENAPAICSHRYIIENEIPLEKLIIIDFEQFTRDVYFDSSVYLSLEVLTRPLHHLQEMHPDNETLKSLLSKCEILFGLVGILSQKAVRKEDYKNLLTAVEQNTKYWRDAADTIQNLITISQELGTINSENSFGQLQTWKELLAKLNKVFITPDFSNYLTFTQESMNGELIIHRTNLKLPDKLAEILSRNKTTLIIDEALNIDDNASFIKKLSGLPQETPLQDINPKKEIKILIVKDVSLNDKENQDQLIKFFEEKIKGGEAVVFTSRKQIEHFTLRLAKPLQARGISVVSQVGGSLGKLTELFHQDPENSVVFLTNFAWERFDHQDLIKNIYVHKLPFMPPSDPYFFTTSQGFNNSFMELAVPKAIFASKRVINRLPKGDVIFLDSRLTQKRYGEVFIDNMRNIAETRIIKLEMC
ncbi:3'-5' exoribonuclease [Candidatus Gracilibacteria bacterium]|nr:3'-5' exoribonuclease [Candidatus Gracilibacteria bacterium]